MDLNLPAPYSLASCAVSFSESKHFVCKAPQSPSPPLITLASLLPWFSFSTASPLPPQRPPSAPPPDPPAPLSPIPFELRTDLVALAAACHRASISSASRSLSLRMCLVGVMISTGRALASSQQRTCSIVGGVIRGAKYDQWRRIGCPSRMGRDQHFCLQTELCREKQGLHHLLR